MNDLPLFSLQPPPAAPVLPQQDSLRDELAQLDPDQMTPREAMDALYHLKALLRG